MPTPAAERRRRTGPSPAERVPERLTSRMVHMPVEGPPLPPEVANLTEAVCGAARRLIVDGLAIGTAGNISARDPVSGLIVVTPARFPYGRLEPADVAVVDGAGRVVRALHRPTSELALHVTVLARRPGVHAVVHTHSPYATAFSVVRRPIPLICNEGLGVGRVTVEVTDFAPPGTTDLGSAAGTLLDRDPGANAFLLANHGVVALGADVEAAYALATQVEWEARIYTLAVSLGEPHVLGEDERRAIVDLYTALPELEQSPWPDLP